ncbi:hypothetical protein NNJEOMEG_01989 [Fundidesulfovibrio magnetotacticus]|uniref:DUF4398 domain-containing protein n=1 Tax=Fundidesulfovibrio magnetotacticus TaxID=2730080 RepID=A0A6V8LVN1_9BACT|nr:hypothetical protein [Fundidesulfovibrio magnetotacticus]GFK94149.1 hypothetical protein NNJEOMEG_01989 [Fundidesulfovibrio magnetotacticus]
MTKSLRLVSALLLLSAFGLGACSKLEVYDRNLQYMNPTIYQMEKEAVARDLDVAQAQFAQAEASGDPQRIKEARDRLKDMQSKQRSITSEDRRRNRTW